MTLQNLDKAPFPWFGGKSKAAGPVWDALGDVAHYVEPFAGSLAVLLNRPHICNRPYFSETVNDLDGFVVNAWRAMQFHPEETAGAASWPVAEADKTARQIAVLKWRTDHNLERLAGDAVWCDPLIAGWWLWSVCVQIGGFAGDGAWTADPLTGRIMKQDRAPRDPGVKRNRPQLITNGIGVNHAGTRDPGVKRDLPHLSDDGQGVNRPGTREPGVSRDRPHLIGNGQGVNHAGTREPGVLRDLPHVSDDGRGVNHAGTREPGVSRQRPHVNNNGVGVNRPGTREPGVSRDRPALSNNGQGVNHPGTRDPGVSRLDAITDDGYHDMTMPELVRWFRHLSARLRHVRILNGDWHRAVTTGAAKTLSVRMGTGLSDVAGIFLDPPYDNNERATGLYSVGNDNGDVAADCRTWCLEHGNDPDYRIVLAGYDTEHATLEQHGWRTVDWYKAGHLSGGMGNTNTTGGTHQQHRERLWLSPHCLTPTPDPNGQQLDMFTTD